MYQSSVNSCVQLICYLGCIWCKQSFQIIKPKRVNSTFTWYNNNWSPCKFGCVIRKRCKFGFVHEQKRCNCMYTSTLVFSLSLWTYPVDKVSNAICMIRMDNYLYLTPNRMASYSGFSDHVPMSFNLTSFSSLIFVFYFQKFMFQRGTEALSSR